MTMDGVREKVSDTLQKMGHKPTLRGGNGTGPTKAEQVLLKELPGWDWNYAISLWKKQKDYPTCYKVDLAYPSLKIAVEIDGYSHKVLTRQVQDRKKEAKLKELGWLVLRVSNERALNNTDLVVQELMSIISK